MHQPFRRTHAAADLPNFGGSADGALFPRPTADRLPPGWTRTSVSVLGAGVGSIRVPHVPPASWCAAPRAGRVADSTARAPASRGCGEEARGRVLERIRESAQARGPRRAPLVLRAAACAG